MTDLRKYANTYAVEVLCMNCHHRDTTRLPKGTPLKGKTSTCSHCGCTAMLRPVRSMGGEWQRPTLGHSSTAGYSDQQRVVDAMSLESVLRAAMPGVTPEHLASTVDAVRSELLRNGRFSPFRSSWQVSSVGAPSGPAEQGAREAAVEWREAFEDLAQQTPQTSALQARRDAERERDEAVARAEKAEAEADLMRAVVQAAGAYCDFFTKPYSGTREMLLNTLIRAVNIYRADRKEDD